MWPHYRKLGTIDASSVQANIHRMNIEQIKSKAQSTFDFNSMYTTLDLEEFKPEMKATFDYVLAKLNTTLFSLSTQEKSYMVWSHI